MYIGEVSRERKVVLVMEMGAGGGGGGERVKPLALCFLFLAVREERQGEGNPESGSSALYEIDREWRIGERDVLKIANGLCVASCDVLEGSDGMAGRVG